MYHKRLILKTILYVKLRLFNEVSRSHNPFSLIKFIFYRELFYKNIIQGIINIIHLGFFLLHQIYSYKINIYFTYLKTHQVKYISFKKKYII